MNLPANSGKVLATLAALVVVAAVTTSIWLSPPSENKARSLDQERLKGLIVTEFAIGRYYHIHHALPADLTALDEETNQAIEANWHDPETRQPLEYQIKGEQSYSLCARFARSSDWQTSEGRLVTKKHRAGRDCFVYNVVPSDK
jgi:hypothetical protein